MYLTEIQKIIKWQEHRKGKYEPFKKLMEKWQNETVAMQHEEFFITAFDGLKLCGRYYEYKKDALIELMFHGYRGNAYRDLSGGVQRCFELGRSAFIVDQRCSGKSEGNVITFGINERRDCLEWIKFMVAHFGSEVKIIFTGISMGASTVLMASGEDWSSNVIGVLADRGYSSPKNNTLNAHSGFAWLFFWLNLEQGFWTF